MIALRLDEALVKRVDRERERDGMSRAEVVRNALEQWLRRRHLLEAVEREQKGYARHPVDPDEFGPVLGAQSWPK